MALCNLKSRFLFEALPDLFPARLTEVETHLWARYYEDQRARQEQDRH